MSNKYLTQDTSGGGNRDSQPVSNKHLESVLKKLEKKTYI
jgi:hypothetical protein